MNFSLAGGKFKLTLSARNGSIVAVLDRSAHSVCRSGDAGLWQMVFRDGQQLNASAFAPDCPGHQFSYRLAADGRSAALEYRWIDRSVTGPHATTVNVAIEAESDGFAFSGTVSSGARDVVYFSLPGALYFPTKELRELVCPMDSNHSVGAAFGPSFFRKQRAGQVGFWNRVERGPRGYRQLFGQAATQTNSSADPVLLSATESARHWLNAELIEKLSNLKAYVEYPAQRDDYDLLLVDSAAGGFFVGHSLDRSDDPRRGRLWRSACAFAEDHQGLALELIFAVVRQLRRQRATQKRGKVLLLDFATSLPPYSRSLQTAEYWAASLENVEHVKTLGDFSRALSSSQVLAIVNPYGGAIPVLPRKDYAATIDAIRAFVLAGGHWFEAGGLPFFYELRPSPFCRYRATYPPAFADFFHIESRFGSAALFGVQPGASATFVPGELECGGTRQGGYFKRSFAPHIHAGASWTSPPVKLKIGTRSTAALGAYAEENQIQKSLEEKLPAAQLENFRRALWIFYEGNLAQKSRQLDLLPAPALVHVCDYLHGGFDRQLPKHLPPNPAFGTEAQFRDFIELCRRRGLLVVPYMNSTWWCGPPDDAVLVKDQEGRPVIELHNGQEGFAVSPWHPRVRREHAKVVRAFMTRLPCDLLFQDQVGSRIWHYDCNESSPKPDAYTQGWLAQAAHDARQVALGTEGGFDHLLNQETLLCGFAFKLAPAVDSINLTTAMRQDYPPDSWRIYPLVQRLAHDKALLLLHNLGQYAKNDEMVAWTLALGFSLAYRVHASRLAEPAVQHWLRWLDCIQRAVCARYVGAPLRDFLHRSNSIAASYGTDSSAALKISVELQPPFDYRVNAPNLSACRDYIAERLDRQTKLWIYGGAQQQVCIDLPMPLAEPAAAKLTLRRPASTGVDGTVAPITWRINSDGGQIHLVLPRPKGNPPAGLDSAPKDWPGAKPGIGILDFPEMKASVVNVPPEIWLAQLSQSAWIQRFELPVVPIRQRAHLLAALQAGPSQWLALLNPYGEHYPIIDSSNWQHTLAQIERYIVNGGCWWESGGHSFYHGFTLAGSIATETAPLRGWQIAVGWGELNQAPERIEVTAAGKQWLGERLSRQLCNRSAVVNRSLRSSTADPEPLILVRGENGGYLGAHHLGGWGWFWRWGGFHPEPELAMAVFLAATEYRFCQPLRISGGLTPSPACGTKYLWCAELE